MGNQVSRPRSIHWDQNLGTTKNPKSVTGTDFFLLCRATRRLCCATQLDRSVHFFGKELKTPGQTDKNQVQLCRLTTRAVFNQLSHTFNIKNGKAFPIDTRSYVLIGYVAQELLENQIWPFKKTLYFRLKTGKFCRQVFFSVVNRFCPVLFYSIGIG
ncbi:MAG: hypothetical protein GY820_45995 [Gammaproteobacteria bacterium]|nr:hypothetical protein [Gammaproteobacteria bacterium]